ncbi:hypothetical protein NIES25_69590 (plasmid) [Nostoc linckia NIES-25]|nr:hypothetical protein NIES25_69590 [Nostoc linckia NIES-25]
MKALITLLMRILPNELVEEINAVSLDELVGERQRAEGRRQKEQLVGDSDPSLIEDLFDLVGILNPDGQGKKAILKLNSYLLPSASCLLPSLIIWAQEQT